SLGGFDASIIYGGDLDLSWRMQREMGLRLAYAPCALIWHHHRTSIRGLFKLYEKNAIANCLLAQRYNHYASYPRTRTFLYLAREAMRSGLRATAGLARLREDGVWDSAFDAVRFSGEASGWLRWHARGALSIAPGPVPRAHATPGDRRQERTAMKV